MFVWEGNELGKGHEIGGERIKMCVCQADQELVFRDETGEPIIDILDELDKKIGTLIMGVNPKDATTKEEKDYWLSLFHLEIEAGERGKGYGTDLIQALIEWAKKRRYRGVSIINVTEDEKIVDRLCFYIRHGFKCETDVFGNTNCHFDLTRDYDK